MQSIRLDGPVTQFNAQHDMDFYRSVFMVGLNGAMAFNLGNCF